MKTHELLMDVATIIRESTSVHEIDCALVDALRRACEHDAQRFPIYTVFLSQLRDVIGSMLLADKPHLYDDYCKSYGTEEVSRVFAETLNCQLADEQTPYEALLLLMEKHVKVDGLRFRLCIENYAALIVSVFNKREND